MDTVVLDIETKSTFGQVGGKNRLLELPISVIGTYSSATDSYFCFDEHQWNDFKKLFATPVTVIGFSSNKFDLPIIRHSLGIDLFKFPRIDISEEIEMRTGRLVSLDSLGQLNLEMKKTHQSIMAPTLYAQGKIQELKEYCLNDVAMTKKLYDLIKKQGFLLVPTKNDEPIKLEINLMETLSLF